MAPEFPFLGRAEDNLGVIIQQPKLANFRRPYIHTAGDDFALSRQRHRAGDREVTDEEGDDADHERRGEEEDDGEKESQEQSEQYGEIPALARRPAMRRRQGRFAGGGIH